MTDSAIPIDVADGPAGGPSVVAAEPVLTFPLSARARLAEQLAQVVLSDEQVAAPLQALVREAATVTSAETGQISIVSTRQISVVIEHGDQHRAKAIVTEPGAISPFEDTVCAVSIRADELLSIPNAAADPRVASIPAVLRGVVGSYLGCPLRLDNGGAVGVLCVYNAEPYAWSPTDHAELSRVADAVSAELRRLAAHLGGPDQ